MSTITNQEAIEIFKERCDDLRKYHECDISKITDRVIENKILWRKGLYELNQRLLELFEGRSGLH